jgi:hypothetical protein
MQSMAAETEGTGSSIPAATPQAPSPERVHSKGYASRTLPVADPVAGLSWCEGET